MKHLAVDIGNSRIKACLVPPHREAWGDVRHWDGPSDFQFEMDEPLCWWIASVHREKFRQLSDWISVHRSGDRIRELSWTDIPLELRVKAPEKVGIDRLCAAVGGHALVGDRACIVVDAGTAITVDGVSANGEFLGGSIFVGVRGALDQLARTTDALPRLDFPLADQNIDPLGQSTTQAIHSGVVLSAAGGISEIVARIQDIFGRTASVVLTGGSAPLLRPFLKFEFRFEEHLVLNGIAAVGRRLENSHG